MAKNLAGATQDEVRRHNLGSLLGLLHVHGPTSRSDLTALTGLNRSTVGALTTDLAEAGLVREQAPVGKGGAGRPSIMVAPAGERVYVLALDVGVDHLVAARVGLGGEVLDRRELRQSRGEYENCRILRHIEALARSVLASAPDDSICVGIGAGVCGVVAHDDGVVRFAPNLGWVDVPFGQQIADRLGTSLPVTVGNDADLGAIAEHIRGAAAGAGNVIYLSGEVGLGGGIIVDGRPMMGAGGYGGEVGHMVVNPRGRLCECGARGCWETEVGAQGARLACRMPNASIDEVMAAYEAGNRKAVAGIDRVGRWLGVGVANLVNLLNPEVIVFGGVLRQLYPPTEALVRESLTHALTAPREQVRLVVPGLGGDSTLLGAAETAFSGLLTDPLGALAGPAVRLRA